MKLVTEGHRSDSESFRSWWLFRVETQEEREAAGAYVEELNRQRQEIDEGRQRFLESSPLEFAASEVLWFLPEGVRQSLGNSYGGPGQRFRETSFPRIVRDRVLVVMTGGRDI